VLGLLAEGLSNKELARRLALSPQTIKNHLSAILGKLGAANRGEAVAIAHRAGLF
jgi:DNA-binding NarL/FixJ family response regulator